MINNYNNAYKDYYDKVRKKAKGKENKISNEAITKDYIYPSTSSTSNVYQGTSNAYQGNSRIGSYNYRGSNKNSNYNKKKFRYLDGFILRLIVTFILFLGVFILKVIPNEEAKDIYKTIKTTISSDFDFKKLENSIESIGIDYSGIKNNIEEKYNEVKKAILDINLDDINEASNL